MSLLKIENLNIEFSNGEEKNLAVRDLSLTIDEGKTLGLVGESGCGKSVTSYSILQLLSWNGKITSGNISYKGKELTSLSEKELRKIRGKEIAMVFQEPMTSLNPVFKIGYQISEVIRLHLGYNKKSAKNRAIELLDLVGIPNAQERYNSYPHELSGGMRQRVIIAMALAGEPSLLIADEPTTALDVTIQAQILELLLNIQKKRKMSLLLITHDLGVVANLADEIAIMYAGEIMEQGTVQQIFANPLHPYTQGLFAAIPKIGSNIKRLHTIPGNVPTVYQQPTGCIFADRCFMAQESCKQQKVKLQERENKHFVKCLLK